MVQRFLYLVLFFVSIPLMAAEPQTHLSIEGEGFRINGRPTYAGRSWNGQKIEGLLLNSRMVQATFDDFNPETRARWVYPDTKVWDADRNLTEFLAAMPEWRHHGLLAITVNLQGGSPQGYSSSQPWNSSGFTESGELRPEFASRMERVITTADDLGMIVIVGYFYFGQDQRLREESAVIAATDAATQWILRKNFRNVLVEVNNECDVQAYDHAILKPDRVHELIDRVKNTELDGRRLLVGTSYGGGTVPRENVVRSSDFLLLHGNGVQEPTRITQMVQQTRKVPGYRPMPILFNEDDHFDFDQPVNNFSAAIGEYASWGYFDYRMKEEGFNDGYQTVPVNWGISSPRKKSFFKRLSEMTGESPASAAAIDRITPRRPSSDTELRYWIENAIGFHRFSAQEVTRTLGLSDKEQQAAAQRLGINLSDPLPVPQNQRVFILPYPGGRHPRIGFLNGAVDPQRETKISIFTPWQPQDRSRADYVVADIPEALWSNLGLTYLAHTHIPTVWMQRGDSLPLLEWNRHPDGSLDIRRELPNGIEFTTRVTPMQDHVAMQLTLKNGSDAALSDLRVQNCVMLREAHGFQAQDDANKLHQPPYACCRDTTGLRWIITAWVPNHRTWSNPRCPCLHSDPQFPDCGPGESRKLQGWLSFYEGAEIQEELQRIDGLKWWER